MIDEIWKARREKLERQIRDAALDLFEHTGAYSFRLPLDPPHNVLFVIAGDTKSIKALMPNGKPPETPESLDQGEGKE